MSKKQAIIITDDQKKIVLDVVLKTTLMSVEEAKELYIQSLRKYITELEAVENDIKKIKSVMKKKPKFFIFDYNAALEQLQQQGILITKQELNKYINIK
jgi:hypothetical protein